VLGLANAGGDAVNCIKQAHEFGLEQTMRIAALLISAPDVRSIGLSTAQGLLLTESFYWDLNDRTRAFTQRLKKRLPERMPDMVQAGCYGVAMHYLKAVAALGAGRAKADGAATVAQMKAMPTDDDAFGSGSIRRDGQALLPVYLFQVKTPAESKGPWDLYKLLVTSPPDQAWQPEDPECGLVHA
jgi:branched-chain amino acid transport system substrate-binding protein